MLRSLAWLAAACTAAGCQVYNPDLVDGQVRIDARDAPTIDVTGERPPPTDAPDAFVDNPNPVDSPDVASGRCGDRTLDRLEECDDGNTADGDGCSSACLLEMNPASDSCPGARISLGPGTATFTGSTVGRGLAIRGACVSGTEGVGQIYSITITAGSRLTVRVVPVAPFNPIIAFTRAMCPDAGMYACSAPGGVGGPATVAITSLTPMSTVFIVVKGAMATTGDYRLELTAM